MENLKFIRLTAAISLFSLSIIFFSAPAALAALKQQNQNIAPERNYERETATFPSSEKKQITTFNPTAGLKEQENKAITKSIIPMIVMGAIVLGIFLWICLNIVKKLLPGGKKLFSSPGLEILGRTHFDSQKYMALVRVGTRVLIVGVSPNGFDQITEISDPDEVTEVLSAAKPKTSSGQNLFYKMFQKQIQNHSSNDAQAVKNATAADLSDNTDAEGPQGDSDQDISGMQERIRKIRNLEV